MIALPTFLYRSARMVALLASAVALAGCQQKVEFIPGPQQHPIDRSLVEYPAGYDLKLAVRFLNTPTALAINSSGTLFIAENGLAGDEVRITGFKQDGSRIEIYPRKTATPPLRRLVLRAPIGGMAAFGNRLYVTHRDENDRGVVTAFDMDGIPSTVVSDLPASGDHAVTDVAIHPDGSRLYFGMGSVTNSGVVGRDNWRRGWVQGHPDMADIPAVPLRLLGYRFDTPRPNAGWLAGDSIVVTAPFHPFGQSRLTWIPAPSNEKPSAAIYSVNPAGGDLRVEAHGIRLPRGLAFNEYGRLYATNGGMELRGTRPIRNDADTLLRVVRGTWYGWPDFTADLQPVTEAHFQPPTELLERSGYPEVSFIIDHQASGLIRPDRHTLLQGIFPLQSGASRLDFVPAGQTFQAFRGSAVVALWGDRSHTGAPEAPPAGRKVVLLDVDSHKVRDFIFNTQGRSASQMNQRTETLERPIDVKFAPDGSLYILDTGYAEFRHGQLDKTIPSTGRLFHLEPVKRTAATSR